MSTIEHTTNIDRAIRRVKRDIAKARIELSIIECSSAGGEAIDAWEEFTKHFRAGFEGLKAVARLAISQSHAGDLETELRQIPQLDFVRQCRNSIQYNGGAVIESSPSEVVTGSVDTPSAISYSGNGFFQAQDNYLLIIGKDGTPECIERISDVTAKSPPDRGRLIRGSFPARITGPYLRLVPVINRGVMFVPPMIAPRVEQNAETVALYCIEWLGEKLSIINERISKPA